MLPKSIETTTVRDLHFPTSRSFFPSPHKNIRSGLVIGEDGTDALIPAAGAWHASFLQSHKRGRTYNAQPVWTS